MLKYKDWPIRRKIVVPIVAGLLGASLLIASIAFFILFGMIRDKTYENLEAFGEERGKHIETYLLQNIERLKLITSRTALRDNLAKYNESKSEIVLATINKIIHDALKPIEEFERICIIDLNGEIITSTDPKFINKNVSDKNFFREGLKKEGVYFIIEDNKTKLLITGPLTIENKVLGVAITVVNTDLLYDILTDWKGWGTTGETYLINKNYEMISPSRFYPNEEVIERTKVETLNAVNCFKHANEDLNGELKHSEVSIIDNYRNTKVLGTHKYIKASDWCLLAEIESSEAFQQTMQIGFLTLSGVGLMVVMITGVGYVVAIKINNNISKLLKGIDIVEKGNLSHMIPIDSEDEIGNIAHAFNKMTQSLKESFEEVDIKVKEQTEIIQKNSQSLKDQQTAILNILEDVEEEKRKAQEYASEIEKFQKAVAWASDQIVITDKDGYIVYANDALEKMTGFTPTEALGKKAGNSELWGGLMPDGFYKTMWKVISVDKKPFKGNITNKRKNGEKYIAKASIAPILDDNGEVIYFVGIERDITKEAEIDKMKTEFISLASHQLRTPLSAMKWFLEMLINGDAGKLNPNQMEYIQNVEDSNERMIALVNDLLNVSRIESGRIMVEPKPTNLKTLVEKVFKEIKPSMEMKNQTFALSVSGTLPEINIDPKLITNVYQNLLTNAVKYTPKGGTITVLISQKNDEVLSQVSDTGLGIPEEAKEKIFTKFYRSSNVLHTETEGSGLGLYLAKAVVETSGGKIWFESEINKGTTFWFTLPLKGSPAKEGVVSID